jgi:TPR repeat protein
MNASHKLALAAVSTVLIAGLVIAFRTFAKKAAEQKKLSEVATATRMKAEQGDSDAQFQLAKLYYSGTGVTKSDAAAVRWYRAAAEQGYAKAQFNLGKMYHDGQGVPKDYAGATSLA